MPADLAKPPSVFVEEHDSMYQFQPQFLAEAWSGHVWLTEIVLAVQRDRSRGSSHSTASRELTLASHSENKRSAI
jgi:hypothetical protein